MRSLTGRIGTASVLLATTGLAALTAGSQSGGSEGPHGEERLSPSARIEQAFRVVDAALVEDRATEALRRALRKADRLPIGPVCAGQTWPSLDAQCLAGSGSRSGQPVRTVTVEYRVGDNISVLVRLPAQQAASR
jgi:hypothetical protein